MKLWIGNLPLNKNDEDIRAFVRKYTHVEIVAITRVDGDGSRPGVLIEIGGATQLMLSGMQTRLNQMYWDQHELTVHIMSFSDHG
jgi:RNA recognition motif-containing protein